VSPLKVQRTAERFLSDPFGLLGLLTLHLKRLEQAATDVGIISTALDL